MYKTMVNFENLNATKQFVDIVSMYPRHEIYLISGLYTIDAHSLIGILSLNITEPMELQVLSEDIPEDFFKAIQPYVCQTDKEAPES